MIALAGKVGAWVFSDEMYRLLELTSGTRLPAAVDRYERAISLAGMSKAFGLAGLRLGWVATHDRAPRRMAGLKDYTTICAPAPSELLALIALGNPAPILEAHRDRVAANMRLASGFFARNAGTAKWIAPEAGTVCFPRLPDEGPSREREPPSPAPLPSATRSSPIPGCFCCPRRYTTTATATSAWVWAARTFQRDWPSWKNIWRE